MPPSAKVFPVLEVPIYLQPWLSIPECQEMLGKGRDWVEARLDANDFDWVLTRGGQKRIAMESIRQWVRETTRAQQKAVGLDALPYMFLQCLEGQVLGIELNEHGELPLELIAASLMRLGARANVEIELKIKFR